MFSRLRSILRSYLFSDDPALYDRYFLDAWEELNQFLHSSTEPSHSERMQSSAFNSQTHSQRREHTRPDIPKHLHSDYAILEIPVQSDFELVKKSYKSLLRKYHPDQYSQDPKKYTYATEITKKLNASFQRIREYHVRRS